MPSKVRKYFKSVRLSSKMAKKKKNPEEEKQDANTLFSFA